MEKKLKFISGLLYGIILIPFIPTSVVLIFLSDNYYNLFFLLIPIILLLDFYVFGLRHRDKFLGFFHKGIYYVLKLISKLILIIKRKTNKKLYKEVENWIEEKKVLLNENIEGWHNP